MEIKTAKYDVGDFVKCIKINDENHEGLRIGDIYKVIGHSMDCGNQMYALRDSKNKVRYAMDLFEKIVTKNITTGKFQVGNIVKVVADGKSYTTYTQWFIENALEFYGKYAGDIFKNGSIGTVVAVNYHSTYCSEILCAVELEDGKIGLIGEEGLETVLVGNDPVNPTHYKKMRTEVIDIIQDAAQDLKGIQATDTGNVIKYVLRFPYKNGLTDLKKAQWYLNHLIADIEQNGMRK